MATSTMIMTMIMIMTITITAIAGATTITSIILLTIGFLISVVSEISMFNY